MRRLAALLLPAVLVCAAPALAKPKAAAKKKPAAAAEVKKKTPANLNLKAPPEAAEPTAASSGAPPPSRGPTRIDFDDRLIQGQTNKSGAVYLYDRKELKTRSMIKKRESFREEIVSSVYDGE